MSSFVHEAANGNELVFHLNEASGVVTMVIDTEDQPTIPHPISIYDGSLPYPALKSGFNVQTMQLVRIELFLMDVLNQQKGIDIASRSYTTDNMEIVFQYDNQYGYQMSVKDFNSFTTLWIVQSELQDVLETWIAWLDKTIGWCHEIEESVL